LCEKKGYTPEEQARYDGFWDAVRIEKTILAEGLEKGEAIGLEKGEAIGLEKGEVIGLEKGEAIGEQKKAVVIALKMLKKSMSNKDISEMTGLSIQQIEELQKK